MLNEPSWHLTVQSSQQNTRTIWEICSKLTIKAVERRHFKSFRGLYLFILEYIAHLALEFFLLSLSR